MNNLKEKVYEYITSNIINGEIMPKQRIDEQQICRELAVSRTPVREALLQLVAEGVLSKESRKGFSVKGLDDDEVSQLYVLIGALDGLAAGLACGRLTEETLKEMEFYTLSMDLAINTANFSMYYKQQLIFHQLYIDRCGNHMLIEKLAELKKKLLKSNYEIDDIEKKKEILLNTNSQHKRMLELFRSRVAKLLREYVEEVHWDAQKASWESF